MNSARTVFEFEHHGNILVVIAHGPFMEFRDNDIRNAYNDAFRLLSEPGTRHLLVDFSQLDYFGSTFVGVLIRLARRARANSGQTALCCLTDNMREMLRTLMLLENPRVDFAMQPYPTREAAIKGLTDPGGASV
jgi:anti-anti-sigma factor